MEMLPNRIKDACNGFHKSAMKKQFYDDITFYLLNSFIVATL